MVTMEEEKILLDFGCGKNKRQGFKGIDNIAFDGVDVVMNIGKDKWQWEDESVDEAHASHFIEHLEAHERVHFINELYRVLKKGAKCTIIVPHWASMRAYGDLTHKFPPVSEFWFYYLSKEWRAVNAPHSQYNESVDFDAQWGHNLHPQVAERNIEYQQFAINNFVGAALDIVATLTKK